MNGLAPSSMPILNYGKPINDPFEAKPWSG